MKLNVVPVLAAMALGLALSSAPVLAQEIRASVPFAFSVRGESLPAGEYTFEVRSPYSVRMRSVTSPLIKIELPVVSRIIDNADDDSRLLFAKDGDARVLSEIWIDYRVGYLIDTDRIEGRRAPGTGPTP
jgi:hypothetical protein